MLAEFSRPDAVDEVVGRASWDGSRVRIEEADPDVAQAMARIFRPVPVVIDDPSMRSLGANGASALEPGDLSWFMAAAASRAEAEGLAVRLVATGRGLGWDPAGAYRTFDESVERRNRLGALPRP